MAVAVQPEGRLNAKRPSGRKIPSQTRRQILRCVVQAKARAVTESAVHLEARNEVLRAEVAPVRGSLHCERPADAERIAELPGLVRQILHRQGVLGEVPSFVVARK